MWLHLLVQQLPKAFVLDISLGLPVSRNIFWMVVVWIVLRCWRDYEFLTASQWCITTFDRRYLDIKADGVKERRADL